MNQFEIIAEPRPGKGSADARRVRRAGRVPAVVYGGKGEPEAVTVSLNELGKQLEHEAFFSHILTLKVGRKSAQVVLKDLQRHPVTARVTHLDLLRVSKDQALTMHIPVHFLNEERAPGRKAGGLFTHHMTEMEITCLPADLPEFIGVDVGAMDVGDVIHLRDLTMPKGVELIAHTEDALDAAVVSVHHAQKLDVEPSAEAATPAAAPEGEPKEG